MAEDKFKDFVEINRSEFESYQGDFQNMWSQIEQGLESKKSSYWPGLIKIAASVLLITIAGWTVIRVQLYEDLPLELYETEQHYLNIISAKMEQVQAYQNEIDALIWEDLELLDQAYEDLKRDFKEQVDQEEVSRAMIENQRAKLEILEQVLDEIESKANDEMESLDI
jgi:hypothetical protein